MNRQTFINTYNSYVKNPDDYLSKYFKSYIDTELPQRFFENPLRKAMLTGYFLRCAEGVIGKKSAGTSDEVVLNLLKTNLGKQEKIEKIANYLDEHDKIGLPEKVIAYSLIPFEETQENFELYAENFIQENIKSKSFLKNKVDIFSEVVYRNVALGYLYKLSEELVEK